MIFWPEISALGVFFYFDNERMHPPKYPSAPPPPPGGHSLSDISQDLICVQVILCFRVSPNSLSNISNLRSRSSEQMLFLHISQFSSKKSSTPIKKNPKFRFSKLVLKRVDNGEIWSACIKYRHLIPATVDQMSASAWLYKNPCTV